MLYLLFPITCGPFLNYRCTRWGAEGSIPRPYRLLKFTNIRQRPPHVLRSLYIISFGVVWWRSYIFTIIQCEDHYSGPLPRRQCACMTLFFTNQILLSDPCFNISYIIIIVHEVGIICKVISYENHVIECCMTGIRPYNAYSIIL